MILTFNYNLVDWVGFLMFNVGNPAVEAAPMGARIFIGLLKAIAWLNVLGFKSPRWLLMRQQ